MKRGKEFDNILDECLGRILVQGESIDQCLESYPQYAAELEPLLRTAMIAGEAVDIQPSPEFKARARFHLRTEMARLDEKPRRSFFSWQPRWAMVAVSVLLVVVLSGSTVLAADSENTLPGNPLYAVKLAVENVRLGLSSSDAAKAQVYDTLADRRIVEIEQLMERGKTELAQRTLARLKNSLEKRLQLSLAGQATVESDVTESVSLTPDEASVKPDVPVQDIATTVRAEERTRLQVLWGRYIVNNPDKVQTMLEEVSPSARPALRRAIVEAVASYRKALREWNQARLEQSTDTSEENTGNSSQPAETSGEEPGNGNSGQQPDTSAEKPGNSNQTPDNTDWQPDRSDNGQVNSSQQGGTSSP